MQSGIIISCSQNLKHSSQWSGSGVRGNSDISGADLSRQQRSYWILLNNLSGVVIWQLTQLCLSVSVCLSLSLNRWMDWQPSIVFNIGSSNFWQIGRKGQSKDLGSFVFTWMIIVKILTITVKSVWHKVKILTGNLYVLSHQYWQY